MAVIAAIAMAAACTKPDSNGDNNGGNNSGGNETENIAEKIEGSYSGYSLATFQYSETPMATAGETLQITASGNDEADIAFNADKFGKFSIEKATVKKNGDTYTVEGSGKTVMGMDPSSEKEYECTVTGTVKDKDADITFSVPAVMGGLKVEFITGEMPGDMQADFSGKKN